MGFSFRSIHHQSGWLCLYVLPEPSALYCIPMLLVRHPDLLHPARPAPEVKNSDVAASLTHALDLALHGGTLMSDS